VSEALAQAEPAAPSRVHYEAVVRDEQRFIASTTAPNVKLFVDRELAVTAATRRRYPRQAIFLDGVYTEAPFLDNEARQYSLDHHSGCVRGFTLATCEQAVVMLLQGLPLDENEWYVYVNEPDLDSVLAAWVLLNHAELLRSEGELLRAAMPLIRVEGVIDAHGLERSVLTGFPRELYDREKQRIDDLLNEERRLKASGEWGSIDVFDYTLDLLDTIDQELFPQGYLQELLATELIEVARAPIQQHKIAILCRSRRGIYAVESELKRRYERLLGVIVLDQGGGRFTLRQVDPFLTRTLDRAYRALNGLDKNVRPDNRWGGSAEIGGSPRATGSGLEADAILKVIGEEYTEDGFIGRMLILFERWWRKRRAAKKAAALLPPPRPPGSA
jgi:hypothetical protein